MGDGVTMRVLSMSVPSRPRTPPGVGTPLRAGGTLLIATRIKKKEEEGINNEE